MNPNVLNINDCARSFRDLLINGWKAYTPTWASSGTQPAIGNGTLVGYFQALSGLCLVNIVLTIGSSTTLGTGTYTFTLPIAMLAGTTCSDIAWNYDASLTDYEAGFSLIASAASTITAYFGVPLGAAAPVTWADGDIITITSRYPVRS